MYRCAVRSGTEVPACTYEVRLRGLLRLQPLTAALVRRRRHICAGVAAALLIANPLLAEPPSLSLEEAVRQAERVRQGRRLRLQITEREAALRPGEALPDTRLRLRKLATGRTIAGTLVSGAAAWRKEAGSGTEASASRTIVGASGGLQRTLFEITVEGAARRQAVLMNTGAAAAGDPILAGHFAALLAGFRESGRQEQDERVEIRLERGGESLSLVAPRAQPLRFERVRLDRPMPGNLSGSRQTYEAELTYEADTITRLEEVIVSPAPNATTAYRDTVVKGSEAVVAEEAMLRVEIPRGTPVRDLRFRLPIEYEQGASDPPAEQIRKLVDEPAGVQAEVGQPAPEWSLKDERGQTVQLSALRGKVVLLYWFASWSDAARACAREVEKEAWDRFRKRGLQVYGIQIAEEGDPAAKARAYRTEHRLTFPILFDNEAVTVRQYGSAIGLPKFALIDRRGQLRFARPGWHPEGLKELIADLLKHDEILPDVVKRRR